MHRAVMCTAAVVAICLAFVPAATAAAVQDHACGTRHPTAQELKEWEVLNKPNLDASEANNRAALSTITVSVYWHAVTDRNCSRGTCTGALSEAAINKQMAILNKAYAGGYAGYGNRRTNFKFSLKGITRTVNQRYFEGFAGGSADVDMRRALRKQPFNSRELNIFSVAGYRTPLGRVLGWASLPQEIRRGPNNPSYDGVSVSTIILPGNKEDPGAGIRDEGKTLVHEVGHWLGLYHTFQGGCSPNRGDYVEDTPPSQSPTFGCPKFRRSCTSSTVRKAYGKYYMDPFKNFMDYSFSSCQKAFTPGQIVRMRKHWLAYRAQPAPKF